MLFYSVYTLIFSEVSPSLWYAQNVVYWKTLAKKEFKLYQMWKSYLENVSVTTPTINRNPKAVNEYFSGMTDTEQNVGGTCYPPSSSS